MIKPKIALTIAGTDPTGGAGVMADLKSFHSCGCIWYGRRYKYCCSKYIGRTTYS